MMITLKGEMEREEQEHDVCESIDDLLSEPETPFQSSATNLKGKIVVTLYIVMPSL